MKPFPGKFSTTGSIPKLHVPASPQHDLLVLQLSQEAQTDSNVASTDPGGNPTLPHWQRHHWEHVEPHPRCCFLGAVPEHRQHTAQSARVQPCTHTCVRTPVYTHIPAPSAPDSGMLPASHAAARKGLRSTRLPSRFSGHIDPDLCCVHLTPTPAGLLLGSSQKYHCCGNAPLICQLWQKPGTTP